MAKRSKWKGPNIPYSYYKKLFINKQKFKFQERNATIVPALLGKLIKIYNGKVYIIIKITQNMLGYKLGDFSLTKIKKNVSKKWGKK